MNSFKCSLFLLLCTIAGLAFDTSPCLAQISDLLLTPTQRLDSAVALLKSTGQARPRQALDMFLRLPGSLVVPRLIDELELNNELRQPLNRRMTYVALSVQTGHSSRRMVELFLDGLEDSLVTDLCLKALRGAPEDQRPVFVDVYRDRLNLSFTESDYISATIINLLLDYGSVSRPALGALGEVFRSSGGGLAANRVGAGLAISEVGGIAAALAEYHDLDSTGLKGALVGLSNLGLQSEGQFDADSSHIRRARQIVLDALTSASAGAVTYATDAIYGVFGTDLYTLDLALNPDIKRSLIAAAEGTSNSDIRRILITSLRRLEEGPAELQEP